MTEPTHDDDIYRVATRARGPVGRLPLTSQMLREAPSGDVFGLSQKAGMGWRVSEVAGPAYLVLSTQGGLRAPDGTPIALGYHTGHWELGLLVERAARAIANGTWGGCVYDVDAIVAGLRVVPAANP